MKKYGKLILSALIILPAFITGLILMETSYAIYAGINFIPIACGMKILTAKG